MTFPAELLADDEDLVLDARPHWIGLVRPAIQSAVILAAVAAGLLFLPYRWGPWPLVAVGLAGMIALLSGPGRAAAAWATASYAVTTHRAIRREGLLVTTSAEAPLDKITNVRSRQSLTRRPVGAGDVIIETAGYPATIRFDDVPQPERVRRVVFERVEVNRMKASLPTILASSRFSLSDELDKLNRLRADGVLTEEEFAALKARLLGRP